MARRDNSILAAVGKLSGRAVCAGALALLLACLAWRAGNEGIANSYFLLANQELNRRAVPGQVLRGDEWKREMQYLTESLRYSPDNAWALEAMGAFQLRRRHAATDPARAAEAVRSANAHFHLALMERPTSPFVWANLALSELYLHDLDEDLFTALRHADALGPWEPEVQYLVSFVGLAAWDRLGPAQRAATVRTMERAARRNAPQVTEMLKSFNRLDLLCDINNAKLKMERLCVQLQLKGPEPRSKRS